MTWKGRVVHQLARVASAGPWRSAIESVAVGIGHRYPTSRVCHSFCKHFGWHLARCEHKHFERIATLSWGGGKMHCGSDASLAEVTRLYYFLGAIPAADEIAVARLFNRVLREGDVFFDVGANVGFYTFLAASHVGRCGSVHAFEANAALLPHLLRSRRFNTFPDRITVTHAVVGQKEEQTQIFYLPADPALIGASSVHLHPWLGAGVGTEVPAVTIDRYVHDKRLAHVDVIKIDIEGGELAAFQGMRETFTHTPPLLIVCELMPDVVTLGDGKPQQRASSAASSTEVVNFLQMRGYQPWHIRTRDGTLDRIVGQREIERLCGATMNVAFVSPSLRRLRPKTFFVDGG